MEINTTSVAIESDNESVAVAFKSVDPILLPSVRLKRNNHNFATTDTASTITIGKLNSFDSGVLKIFVMDSLASSKATIKMMNATIIDATYSIRA